jgi:predicted nucleic acid-binding protein
MTTGIVDTTVIIHYFRGDSKSRAWVDAQPVRLSIVSITWMEIMEGTSNKTNQARCKEILSRFNLLYPMQDDQAWAMQKLEQFQFSDHIGKEDCLIASVAQRLQTPLYTDNLRDTRVLIGSLAIRPY